MIPQKWVVLMVLLIVITGQSQYALSQDKTEPSYHDDGHNDDDGNYYDGNYVLPSVGVSSYPTGYQPQFYYIPRYRWSRPPNISTRSAAAPIIHSWDQKNPWNQGHSWNNQNVDTPSPSNYLSADGSHTRPVVSTSVSDENASGQSIQDAESGLKEGGWQPLWGILSEIRLGAGRHDSAVVGRRKEDGIDLDAELLFASPTALDYIWSPRPTLGLHANIKRKKNTSQAYGGLTWEWWPLEPVFINFFFGFSYHNGEINTADPNIKSLGTLWLFRESLSIGWQTAGGFNISAYLDHASNGTLLAKKNEGIDTLGLRLGYRF